MHIGQWGYMKHVWECRSTCGKWSARTRMRVAGASLFQLALALLGT